MSSGDDSYDGMEDSWIEWFCNLKGNEFFCEVDRSYIEDGFNLYGLRNSVHNFVDCLHLILDDKTEDGATEDSRELLMNATRLYGLIHARFILTTAGLDTMYSKFLAKEFGLCPRVHCRGQPVLPVGISDELDIDTVKIFCPLCGDIYTPMVPPDGSRMPDGAYFGRTFAHLFFMTFEDQVPDPIRSVYVPRVFGFKVNQTSKSLCTSRRGRGNGVTGATLGSAEHQDMLALQPRASRKGEHEEKAEEPSLAGQAYGQLVTTRRGNEAVPANFRVDQKPDRNGELGNEASGRLYDHDAAAKWDHAVVPEDGAERGKRQALPRYQLAAPGGVDNVSMRGAQNRKPEAEEIKLESGAKEEAAVAMAVLGGKLGGKRATLPGSPDLTKKRRRMESIAPKR